jgi:hypothetical protein
MPSNRRCKQTAAVMTLIWNTITDRESRQYTHTVIVWRVRVTTAAMETQAFYRLRTYVAAKNTKHTRAFV